MRRRRRGSIGVGHETICCRNPLLYFGFAVSLLILSIGIAHRQGLYVTRSGEGDIVHRLDCCGRVRLQFEPYEGLSSTYSCVEICENSAFIYNSKARENLFQLIECYCHGQIFDVNVVTGGMTWCLSVLVCSLYNKGLRTKLKSIHSCDSIMC